VFMIFEADETAVQISMVEEQLFGVVKSNNGEQTQEKERCYAKVVKQEQLPVSRSPHVFPCKDTYAALPKPSQTWPQNPLMLRPTPYTTTKIKGIRRASKANYEHFTGFCAGCILPINNGREVEGDSLVIDFESSHFEGALLLRIKQAPENKNMTYQQRSYFDGKKRKFQAVIKGRFKTPLEMSQCVTGQTFDRPAGKLPARWIVSSLIKFMSTLAPQLEATLEGDRPRFLTPLVATAQTVLVTAGASKDCVADDIEKLIEEPCSSDPSSIMLALEKDLGLTNKRSSSVTNRMKRRKKAFNSVAAKKKELPRFSTDKEYTFEFYQHLLGFGEELAIEMGRPIGSVGLAHSTDGQPIKIMSAYKDNSGELDSLWSFDIWHASLLPYAEVALKGVAMNS